MPGQTDLLSVLCVKVTYAQSSDFCCFIITSSQTVSVTCDNPELKIQLGWKDWSRHNAFISLPYLKPKCWCSKMFRGTKGRKQLSVMMLLPQRAAQGGDSIWQPEVILTLLLFLVCASLESKEGKFCAETLRKHGACLKWWSLPQLGDHPRLTWKS